METGHLDHHLKLALRLWPAVREGHPNGDYQCGARVRADRYRALAPGKRADINIVSGDTADDFGVVSVWSRGKQIVDHGKMLVHYETAQHDPCLLNTMTL